MENANIVFGNVGAVMADPARTVDRQGMYQTIADFVDALMTQRSSNGQSVVHARPASLTVDELLETEPVREETTGRQVGERCRFELRTTSLTLPEKGVVGVANRRDVWENLEFNHWASFDVLVAEQPQAQFALVGASVQPFDRKRTVTSIERTGVRDLAGERPVVLITEADIGGKEKRGLAGTVEHRAVEEPQVAVTLVWADIAQTKFVDPNAAHTSNRDTPVRDYIETRLLSRMPAVWRLQRQEAVAVLQEARTRAAAKLVVPAPLPPAAPAPAPAGLSYETLAQRYRDGVPLETLAAVLGKTLEETARALGVELKEELPLSRRKKGAE